MDGQIMDDSLFSMFQEFTLFSNTMRKKCIYKHAIFLFPLRSLVAQTVKNLPAMQGTCVRSLRSGRDGNG